MSSPKSNISKGPSMLSPSISFIMILLGIAGFIDSLIIAGAIHLTDGQCSGLGSCDKVLQSSYASFAGISLWILGAAFYTVYTSLLIIAVLKKNQFILKLCFCMLIIGVGFSLYLIYLQYSVIRAWCPLCLISAIIQFFSFISCILLLKTFSNIETKESLKTSLPSLFAGLSVSLLILTSVFFMNSYLWPKISSMKESNNDKSELVTRIDDQEINLSDFPQYLKMKLEFDQYVWSKSKEWYYNKVLTEQAKRKGFDSATAYIDDAYLAQGGKLEYGAREAKILFNAFKKDYMKSGQPLPSDNELFDMLETKHRKQYQDFYHKMSLLAETELKTKHMLAPLYIRLDLDPDRIPILGPETAPIKLVLISDFHCVHCRKMHQVVKEIRDELGHENVNIAYINHYWDLLPNRKEKAKAMTLEEIKAKTTLAMRAAYAAWQQNKFWEYSDLIFDNQDSTNLHSLSTYQKFAKDLQLNMTQFDADLASQKAYDFIEAQRPYQELAYAERPPTVLVNGFFVKSSKTKILEKIKELDLIDTDKTKL